MVLFISKDFTERNLKLLLTSLLTTDFYYRKCMMASYLQEMYGNKLQGVT